MILHYCVLGRVRGVARRPFGTWTAVVALTPPVAAIVPVSVLTIARLLARRGVIVGLLLRLLRFPAGIRLALRFAQHTCVVLGVLLKILGGDAVIRQLRIPRQLIVFVDDLLWRSANLAFRP